MTKILLIEDDKDYADLLSISLKKAGWDVDFATSVSEAYDKKSREFHDLVLLDVMLPDGNGYDFCKSCFENAAHIPIIMLSAVRQSEEDKILGLECGAVDYVLKSNSHKELIARIKRILVQHVSESERNKINLRVSEKTIITLDVFHQKAYLNNKLLSLTSIEFQLLYILCKNVDKALTHGAILKLVWEFEPSQSSTLKVHLYRLKKKLSKFVLRAELDIVPIRGSGYMLATKKISGGGGGKYNSKL